MPVFSHELETGISGAKFWASVKDHTAIFPKIMSEDIASMKFEQGAGELGSVRVTKFAPGSQVKEKLVGLQPQKLCVTWAEIEGGHLRHGFSKWIFSYQVVAIDDTKCKLKFNVEFDGGDLDNSEGFMEDTKRYLTKAFKALEQYLKQNPSTA
ncbi:hypothetical protein R1sor_023110 [Riccia sorocarpa]|uniref:Bet v I/Major latex protein domain-containing protein n=1 Tax=Riccia sorocarpa TaxID=122646 RepID=A0ABD3GQX6_9MARC